MGTIYKIYKAVSIGDVLNIIESLRDGGLDMSSYWIGHGDGSITINPKDGDLVSIEVDNGPDAW